LFNILPFERDHGLELDIKHTEPFRAQTAGAKARKESLYGSGNISGLFFGRKVGLLALYEG
jgi:hypothetical protein